MLPDFAQGSVLWEAALGTVILGAAIGVAFLALPLLTRIVKLLTGKTKTTLDDLLLQAVKRPLFVFVVVHGVFLALTSTSFLDHWQSYITQAWFVSGVLVVLYALQRVTSALIQWYGSEVATRTGARLGENLLPLVRRFINVSLLIVGVLLILDNLGIQVSPLLAGLGIGGLAVALALQPTLSNFFAGTYLVSGNVLKAGDFIEMEGGVRGYVVEVGWRSTRIRTPFNNLVVMPNSRIADSILTNYSEPSTEMGMMVEAGVSYSSNLAHVREVVLEEASQLIEEMPEADKSTQPWFGYERFGDSNVDFWVWLQSKDRISSFALKTELMIRLHERFAKEGIEINYPVRKLVYSQEDRSAGPRGPSKDRQRVDNNARDSG